MIPYRFKPNQGRFAMLGDDINEQRHYVLGLLLRGFFQIPSLVCRRLFVLLYILMRLPSFPSFVRKFYALTNATTKLQAPQKAVSPFIRATAIKSMPTIPFFGSLFSSSSSSKDMSFPDQRSDQEWQAVLNKGMSSLSLPSLRAVTNTVLFQNNSASCVKRELKLHSPENMTSICLNRVSTRAPLAMRHSTRQTTNSSRAADGRHTSTTSQAL
jgi:hypothetical protein